MRYYNHFYAYNLFYLLRLPILLESHSTEPVPGYDNQVYLWGALVLFNGNTRFPPEKRGLTLTGGET
jgi:hypothetical protein